MNYYLSTFRHINITSTLKDLLYCTLTNTKVHWFSEILIPYIRVSSENCINFWHLHICESEGIDLSKDECVCFMLLEAGVLDFHSVERTRTCSRNQNGVGLKHYTAIFSVLALFPPKRNDNLLSANHFLFKKSFILWTSLSLYLGRKYMYYEHKEKTHFSDYSIIIEDGH